MGSIFIRRNTICRLTNILKYKRNHPCLLSTVAVEQVDDSKHEDTHQMTVKIDKKKPQKPPFAKNLFLGKFDSDILTYPEILEKDELKKLEDNAKSLNESLKNDTFENILDKIKSHRLFGQEIPQEFGGLQLTTTESARIQEAIASSPSLSTLISSQQHLGIKALLKHGNDEQIQIINSLVRGDKNVAFCFTEKNTESVMLSTFAEYNVDTDTWVINGEKHWIVNASKADYFIVITRTKTEDHKSEMIDSLTAFLLDKNTPGINISPIDTLGVKDANMCTVNFNNVLVQRDDILGNLGEGTNVIMTVVPNDRLNIGALCSSILRTTIDSTIEHAINFNHINEKNVELEWIKMKMSKIATNAYAMESMTYLTAGLIDGYKDQDCNLESAIVKVFSSEQTWNGLHECSVIQGPVTYDSNHPINKTMMDVRHNLFFNETNLMLKLYIGLAGLQHTGICMSDEIRKIRNPLFYPGYILGKIWKSRRQSQDDPKLTLNLEYYLHPSLQNAARWLEYAVLRLQYATECLLARHGLNIVDKHTDLERLANVAIDIYGMVAVLGRASRSYCIGLRNAEGELFMATAFCQDAMNRVKQTVKDIDVGSYGHSDAYYCKLSDQLFESKRYFPEHPLTKNF